MFQPKLFYNVIILLLISIQLDAQSTLVEKPRITVAKGLPQSYISGIVQDSTGFVWISTRDGLARFDGKRFKYFGRGTQNSNKLISNNIAALYLHYHHQLWIQYENGEIDVLNTRTEQIFRFTQDKTYRQLRGKIKNVHAIVSPRPDLYWLLGENGSAHIIDIKKKTLRHFTAEKTNGSISRILGMEASMGNILITTDKSICKLTETGKLLSTYQFDFPNPHLFDTKRPWKDSSPIVRKNGDIVIFDKGRLITYLIGQKKFQILHLPEPSAQIHPSHTFDKKGNLWFGSNGKIYRLSPLNKLATMPIQSSPGESTRHLMIDRSDVLWAGTNGFNLRQFDLRLPRMPAKPYQRSFHKDLLHLQLSVAEKKIAASPLAVENSYLLRSTIESNGKIWFTMAGEDTTSIPNVCYYHNGQLVTARWHFVDQKQTAHSRLNALALSNSGKLWALDAHFRLLKLDTTTHTVHTTWQLPVPLQKQKYEVHSMVIEGEDDFYFTTSAGFYSFHLPSKKLTHLSTLIPGAEYTTLTKDPRNNGRIWAGTLGDGLLCLDLKNNRRRIYSMSDGLPNNTVYAMLPYGSSLWCSTNRGIFSLDLQRDKLQSYSSLDGLPEDEFNRFHYLILPDQHVAFGGTQGYTVFSPTNITFDNFSPEIALTNLKINSQQADFGNNGTPLTKAINSMDTLVLSYQKNFLEFEFAALEYNIPEKLNYRYIMEGLESQWTDGGTEARATYTNLSPGTYLFKVNASNVAGEWSRYTRKLTIMITPPFWQTWWFIMLISLLLIAITYIFFILRIFRIRERDRKKHELELEMVELEGQALRAQMNPHFIFNCLNSIKSLIQENAGQQAITYLSTFSKLIRTQLSNDQPEISLADEIKNCKLYLDMEKLRYGDKVNYRFLIDDDAAAHNFMVPPLLLQPLVENAIWHGIIPMARTGFLIIKIFRDGEYLKCQIIDNGIGVEASLKRKKDKTPLHESKGLLLIKNRLRVFEMRSGMKANITIGSPAEGQLGTIAEVTFLIEDN